MSDFDHWWKNAYSDTNISLIGDGSSKSGFKNHRSLNFSDQCLLPLGKYGQKLKLTEYWKLNSINWTDSN